MWRLVDVLGYGPWFRDHQHMRGLGSDPASCQPSNKGINQHKLSFIILISAEYMLSWKQYQSIPLTWIVSRHHLRERISVSCFPGSLLWTSDSCDSAAVTDGLRCYYSRTNEGKGWDLKSFHFSLAFASSLAESTASHMVMLWQLFGFLRHKVSLKSFSNGP